MFEFINPGFVAAGGALVSSPIIIHLINRMRYKRIRWAAMEFLLKSQKKNRRRLIIEQMILLFLRCLLVVLAMLLVARLLKITFGGSELSIGKTNKQKSVHLVLLDDSASMTDWVDDARRNHCFNCFEVAKEAVSTEIAKNAGNSTTPQDLYLVVLSEAAHDPKYRPKLYEKLNDESNRDALKKDLSRLKCTSLHIPLIKGVNVIQALADEHKEDQVVVHVMSDFRNRDWSSGSGTNLGLAVANLASGRGKVNLIDTAYPYRTGIKAAPQRHENVGITEFSPETRIVASDAYVRFKLNIHNYGSTMKKVRVALFDSETGQPYHQFEDGVYHDVSPGQDQLVNIDAHFHKEEAGYAQISAKLELPEGEKESADGMAVDNVRHAAVFVQPKIPVLIVDGDKTGKGRADGGDTRHIAAALDAAPGAGYEIQPDLSKEGGGTVEELDQGNLDKYPSIFLLNVPNLEKEQQKNLEAYVANGGSVAFFLGPLVDPQFYNNNLYKKGQGLFPVELLDQYYPPRDKQPLKPNLDDGHYKVLFRDDLFSPDSRYPIFGVIHERPFLNDSFKYLPIYRFFPIRDLSSWKTEAKKSGIDELATMPNMEPVSAYASAAKKIRDELARLADEPKNENYRAVLNDYRKKINKALERDRRGNIKDCYELADVLNQLLIDPGTEDRAAAGRRGRAGDRNEQPSMIRFWRKPDNDPLKVEITELWEKVRYGSPLVVSKKYGRGRVVAVMTTAGKEWNDWLREYSYVPMVLEMQSYLTSLGSESNLKVGDALTLQMGKGQFAPKVRRTYFMPWLERLVTTPRARTANGNGGAKNAEGAGGDAGQEKKADMNVDDYTADRDQTGRLSLVVKNILKPGFYRFDLTQTGKKDDKAKPGIEQRGYAFNVDTENEGDLQRVSREALLDNFQGATAENVKLYGPFEWGTSLVDRQTDFSEWAWFFLIFMLILVAEQALAVHLSFHLRDTETALPAQALRSQAMA